LAGGDYTVRWDGKNQRGNAVSGGIYIYKMVNENLSISKKMILAR
jgi:flagellar hook assembly protein FlgD